MLTYPARVHEHADGYVVTFRDIPEANTSGATFEQAVDFAADALATAMDFYFEDQRLIPDPSKARRGEVLVSLPTSVSAKALLLNEMIKGAVSAAQLARRLKTSPQAVNRIVDIRHSTKIDTISDALEALGKRLVLSVA